MEPNESIDPEKTPLVLYEGGNPNPEGDIMRTNNGAQPQPGEYVEKRDFCFCFSLKCGIIFVGILLLIDVVLEALACYEISQNDTFDGSYLYVYIFLVVVLFVAANMYFYYLVAKDSPDSRAVVPWALLVASIASFLIAIWIIYYITCMYSGDKVSIVRYSSKDEDDDYDDDGHRKKHYTK